METVSLRRTSSKLDRRDFPSRVSNNVQWRNKNSHNDGGALCRTAGKAKALQLPQYRLAINMRKTVVWTSLAVAASARQVNITVDASHVLGDLPPTARFFGADEPNQATYPDGEKLIHDLGDLGPHQTYFRTHNLLTTCDPPNNVNPKRFEMGMCVEMSSHSGQCTDLMDNRY